MGAIFLQRDPPAHYSNHSGSTSVRQCADESFVHMHNTTPRLTQELAGERERAFAHQKNDYLCLEEREGKEKKGGKRGSVLTAMSNRPPRITSTSRKHEKGGLFSENYYFIVTS